jgi:hypothetical protein
LGSAHYSVSINGVLTPGRSRQKGSLKHEVFNRFRASGSQSLVTHFKRMQRIVVRVGQDNKTAHLDTSRVYLFALAGVESRMAVCMFKET